MKKFKKYLLISIIILVLLGVSFLIIYNIFRDKNSLNVIERTWINNNKANVVTVNIRKDINTFSKDGEGVFYDFLDDISDEYDITINPNVISSDENSEFGFNKGTSLTENDLLFFTDNYVLVSKNLSSIADINNLKDKKIGLLSSSSSFVAEYYTFSNNFLNNYDSVQELFDSFDKNEVDYMILPLNEYKDEILNHEYKVVYNFNDLKIYYYFTKGQDETLNSIFNKFYNNWIKDDLEKSYYEHNYELFIKALKISEADEDTLNKKDYIVGVMENYPYQMMQGGKFYGLVDVYLQDFAKFAKLDFKYKKYKNSNALNRALINNKVNLAFNSFENIDELNNIDTNIQLSYVIVEPNTSNNTYDSLKSIKGTVYALEGSKLANALSNNTNFKVATYKNNKELKKLMKKGNIMALDKLTYESYAKEFGENYSVRLSGSLSGKSYTFTYNGYDTFSKLFSNYIMTLNNDVYKIEGLDNFQNAYFSANQVAALAKYVLLFLVIIVILIIYFIRRSRKVVLNTKIKKDDKLKFIDMLTSLKNRNYLNEKMEIWNQNTIYPQSVIVIDLNNVKYLNDTFGHEEGDKQIQGAANVLIKTQLDNTEILRTDGNEFMVYMVGYSEKQVISYIKKLLKEFKKLPYDYSAAIGFSMIVDDLKLVEDAINEASEMMRENKPSSGEGHEEN